MSWLGCLLLVLSLFAVWLRPSANALDFSEWCLQYGKSYASEEEAREKEEVYHENAALVERLNKHYAQSDVGFELNQFADLTSKQFRQQVLMSPSPPPTHEPDRYVSFEASDNPPDSFDWRDHGVVTDVKDQGTVGSCWAFSTVENIEGQWAKAGHNLTSLSEEQLVECDDEFDPDNLHMDCGVFGGWPYLAYQYIKKVGGIEREQDYPYCSGSGKCFACVPAGYNKTRCGPPPLYCNKTQSCPAKLDKSKFVPGLKVDSWMALKKGVNESAMVTALLETGPLSVLINAELLQFYKFGVWNLPGCDPNSLDHAVLLVGYGVDKTLFRKKPYWLIKNSWGKNWGQKGYFKLARGKGKCGVNQGVTSAILSKGEGDA